MAMSRRGSEIAQSNRADELIIAERDMGSGAQTLYAYYLPTYRRLAENGGESSWLMRVGITTESVESMLASSRAVLPEVPALAIVVRTDDAELLQRLVHMVLDLRSRRATSGGGDDWFITNGDEIAGIYSFVLGDAGRRETGRTYESAPTATYDSVELAKQAEQPAEETQSYWTSTPNVLADDANAFERLS